ncbi:MAG: family 16 glycosylhydrolase [Sedimentisphaerales bacterium]|nr:family 16 glycosylhydrolase [Sedimentisphaerales bacterium]
MLRRANRRQNLLVILLITTAASILWAQQKEPRSWERVGPLGSKLRNTTDAYPLSGQANKAGWVKYAPMSDEFDGHQLDPEKWWPKNPSWFGREPAWFDPANVRVADGKLHLSMKKNEPPDMPKDKGYHTYTSAAVQSKGLVKYGYFEVKCKPMASAGSSSFWFYHSTPNLWTEIDVFEIGGRAPGFEKKYNMTLHVFKTPTEKKHWSKGGVWMAPTNLADDYHVYALEWDTEKIKWYFDGVLVRWVENTHWHQSLTLNFDSETMPDWFGLPKDSDLPSTYSIEYVRAWKRPGEGEVPLFLDTEFQHGFLLSYADSSKGRAVEAVLDTTPNSTGKPAWRLCQWATNHSLAGVKPAGNSLGDLIYENEGKKVLVAGPNSPNADLILEIKGDSEYGQAAREPGQPWPHLLVEQDAPLIYTLDALDAVTLNISFRILHCKNNMSPQEYDPSLHAVQFQLFLIVKNVHTGSKDHGDYFWFGVPFFDNRHDIPPSFIAKDVGKEDATGKLICTIDGRSVNSIPPINGNWIAIQQDLLPHINAGLKEAVKRGYLSDSTAEHYAVANMNLGWEIPGSFNAAVQIRGFTLSADIKDDQSAYGLSGEQE